MADGPRGPTASTSRARRRLHAVVAGVVTALTILPGLPSAAAGTPAPDEALELTVTDVSPAVTGPADPVVITVDVRTRQGLEATTLQVRDAGGSRGAGRSMTATDITAWATDTTPAPGRLLAQAEVPAIPAGGRSAVAVTIPRAGDLSTRPFDAVPVSLELGSAIAHTFVGLHRAKEYEPLSLAWLLPVTLDPDPALQGPPSPDRWQEWQRALAPAGRLDRLITALTGPDVSLAVDADLLTPLSSPADGRDPDTLDPDLAEDVVRADGARRLRAALGGRAPLVLPAGDPDLAALGTEGTSDPTLRRAARTADEAARAVAGQAGVVWPADTTWSPDAAARYAAQLGTPLDALVVDRDRLTWQSGQGDAGRRATDGTLLLVRDNVLSEVAARALRADASAATRQEFLAQSLAVLRESPGLARTVLVAPDRGLDPDPAAAAALRTLLGAIPWLGATTLTDILDQAGRADPLATQRSGSLPPQPPPPFLDAPTLTRLAAAHERAGAIAGIRQDRDLVLTDWQRRLTALTATAWRADPEAARTLLAGLDTEFDESSNGVRVAPQTINFLADKGKVQVTVVNTLPVGVEDVRIRLVTNDPELRIPDNTQAVSIGANSRATVVFEASALAAGRVTIDAKVLAPSGIAAGPTTTVLVRVTPTGAAVYWVLGGIIVLVLAVGLWRSRRARSRRGGADPANVIHVDEDDGDNGDNGDNGDDDG